MAAYKLFNPSYKETIQFSSVFDYNNIECLTITPRSGLSGTNDLLGPYGTSIEYGRERLIKEIFEFAAKYPGKLEITKDGQAVNYTTYQQDFVGSNAGGGNTGGSASTSGKDFEESTWTDGTNYYVRRSVLDEATNTYTTSFTNPDGTAANPDINTIYPYAKDVDNPPLTYSNVTGSPFTLTSAWVKVATTTKNTKGFRISPLASASTFDIEWISVVADAATPTDTVGEAILGGEDFGGGIPIGDIYLKSASGQKAIVKVGV